MHIRAGELLDLVTVLSASGEARDELNLLTDRLRATVTLPAKVTMESAADSAQAGGTAEAETYRVLIRNEGQRLDSFGALDWCGQRLHIKSRRYIGSRREGIEMVCVAHG